MISGPTPTAESCRPVVMLVDDHEDSVAMYALALQMMGFEPLWAMTVEEAYARIREMQPDVVVADIALQGASGIDLARRLREDPRTRDTAIIVLTGYGGSALERQANAAGCDRFLRKPCMPDALALEIRDVLASRPTLSR